MNENTCICPFVKSRVSAGTRKRRSKKGDLSCRIDCYSYMARFGTKHAGQAISRAYGKSNSLFLVKFCYILPACLTKNRLYTFKIVHLNAVITLSNNKQNKYSNSIYKIYLKPCHDHCILPTYFQNNKKTQRPGPSFVYFKKISVLSISEYFSISVFHKFVVNLPITFAVCKFARTSQIWR